MLINRLGRYVPKIKMNMKNSQTIKLYGYKIILFFTIFPIDSSLLDLYPMIFAKVIVTFLKKPEIKPLYISFDLINFFVVKINQ